MPPAAIASASSIVAQQAPIAPARTSRPAMAAHLCALACGRRATPEAAACAAIRAMLASRMSSSISSAGEGRSSRAKSRVPLAEGPMPAGASDAA